MLEALWPNKKVKVFVKNIKYFSNPKIYVVVAALALIAMIGYVGFVVFDHLRNTSSKVAGTVNSPKPVQVVAAKMGLVDARISAAVVSRSSAEIPVRLKLTVGQVVAVPVEVGDIVKPGQILVRVSADLQRAALESATSQLAGATEQQRAAQSRWAALADLHKRGWATDEELWKAIEGKASGDSQLSNAQFKYAQAKDDLTSTVVTSAVSGIVTSKNAYPGKVERQATDMLTIAVINPVWIEASLSDEKTRFIHLGQDIVVSLHALPGREIAAKIAIIKPNIDEKTRLVNVVAKVSNPDLSIKPGMQGLAFLKHTHKALRIPTVALISPLENTAYVFVVEKGSNIVRSRRVSIGPSSEGYTEITKNLVEGERVVVVGQTYLHDGDKVDLREGEK